MTRTKNAANALQSFHPAVREWFQASFPAPTKAQQLGWPAIISGDWTLILAPTGSGKTLTAFLTALDRLMFSPLPAKERRCRAVDGRLDLLLRNARKLMLANVRTRSTVRRATGSLDPRNARWVFSRGGQPCRKCRTPIRYAKQGRDARGTWWCPRCQT